MVNPSENILNISKIFLEELPVDNVHPFGDDLKKIPREDLGLFVLDPGNKKIVINDPDFLIQIPGNNAAAFKFTYTAKSFSFIPKDESKGNNIVLGKVYLRINYYSSYTGKQDTTSAKVYILDRIFKQ